MGRISSLRHHEASGSTEVAETERCTPDQQGCAVDLRPQGARVVHDSYTTYLPVAKHTALVTRFDDGISARGRDSRGRSFEVVTARNGSEVFVRRGEEQHRFVIDPRKSILIETPSYNRSVDHDARLSPAERELLFFGLRVHAQATLRTADPREALRAAARTAEAEHVAKMRLGTTLEGRIDAAIGKVNLARANLEHLVKTKSQERLALEKWYHYAHQHYPRLKGRLDAADGEKVTLDGRPLPTLFRARNALRNDFRRSYEGFERAAGDTVSLLDRAELKALPEARRTELVQRIAIAIAGSSDGALALKAIVDQGLAGQGPVAHFAPLALPVIPKFVDKGASVIGKSVKALDEWKHPDISKTTGAVAATIRTVASIINIAAAMERLARGGADVTREATAITGAATSVGGTLLKTLGKEAASKIASKLSFLLTAAVAIQDFRLNSTLAHKIGQVAQMIGGAIGVAIPGVGALPGAVLIAVGAFVSWVGDDGRDPKLERELAQAGYVR